MEVLIRIKLRNKEYVEILVDPVLLYDTLRELNAEHSDEIEWVKVKWPILLNPRDYDMSFVNYNPEELQSRQEDENALWS